MSGKDPIEMLVKDHRAIDHTFAKLRGTEDPLKRTEYASQLIRMLAIHSMTEEVDVYPYYPSLLDHGSDEKQHVLREHLQLDNTMRELEKLEPTDPKWAETVEFAYKKYTHHIREEEEEQFPQLRAKLTVKELEDMAGRMEVSRRLVPTHPHPDVPEVLRESKVAGSLIGLMDRMRDLFTNASKNELNL